MPTLTASDVVAIVAIVVGLIATLAAVVLGGVLQSRHQHEAERRAYARAQEDRLMQSRLRAIEDTQRYVGSMLDHLSSLAILGLDKVGPPPNPGDFPKSSLALIGDSRLVMALADLVHTEAARARAGGPPWSEKDNEHLARLGGAITRALRDQEERALAGNPPSVPSAEQQHEDMTKLLERQRSSDSAGV